MSGDVVVRGGGFDEASVLAQAESADPRVAALLAGAERTLGRLPSDEVVSSHLAAMLREAHAAPAVAEKPRSLHRRRIFILLAATVALSTMLVGFSYAGFFTFPEPVRSALSWVGIDVPGPPPAEADTSGREPANTTVQNPPGPAGGAPQDQLPAGAPGLGDRPNPARGDQPERPGGVPGDQPGGGGDRPDRPASPCPFPQDILGCDEGGD